MKELPYNDNRWTAARFNTFIKSALRAASVKWPPRYEAKKKAWIKRGVYKCAGFKCKPHEAKAKDVDVDHIDPVINPRTGFTTWDELIARMFVDSEGFQVLCRDCHKKKTEFERKKR